MPSTTPGTKMASVTQVCCSEWLLPLRCGLCQELFRKPRILPCGHTFCSDCLNELRDKLIRSGRQSPLFTPVYNSSFPDPNGGYGTGITFECPDLECQYSMKLMNLSRWALRNRAVQDLVAAFKRHDREQTEVSTQTDIGLDSALVAIPRSLIPTLARSSTMKAKDCVDNGEQTHAEVDHSVTVGKILQRAFSMDSLNQTYVPTGVRSWKSCVALLGANILEQLIRL